MSLRTEERLLAAAIVCAALFVAIGAPSWWGHERHLAPKTGNFWLDAARPRERKLLSLFPTIVQRRDLKLTLNLENGGRKEYVDTKSAHEIECGFGEDENTDDCIAYHVWEISPDRRYVTLWIGYYEGGGALLVDRLTGAELGMAQPPSLSPDARHWALVDEDYAFGTGEVSVIAAAETPRVIAAGTHSNCLFQNWETNSAFLIACYDFDRDTYAEFRVTWNEAGTLSIAPTGRTISGEL